MLRFALDGRSRLRLRLRGVALFVLPGRAASGSPLQKAQLLLHRVEKLVRLLRDRVPAETHAGKDQEREHTADRCEAPPARSRPEPSKTARASVEKNGE